MEKEIIAAGATIVAALVALFGAVYTQRKTAENSRAVHAAAEKHEEQLSRLTGKLEEAVHRANSAYTKKLDVLSTAYAMLGEIKFLVEKFLVAYTEYSTSGDKETLQEACLKFEELRKYHIQYAIFFDSDDQLGPSMGTLMGELNRINTLQREEHSPRHLQSGELSKYWYQQVASFQSKVEPAVASVKEQFRRALSLAEGDF